MTTTDHSAPAVVPCSTIGAYARITGGGFINWIGKILEVTDGIAQVETYVFGRLVALPIETEWLEECNEQSFRSAYGIYL